MRTGILFIACLIAAAAGCVGERELAPAPGQEVAGPLSIPRSAADYRATYMINENGAEIQKTVWRSGSRARVDLAYGEGAIGLYFASGRAYSCRRSEGSAACFDVTSTLEASRLGEYFLAPDLSDAVREEDVAIGQATGSCYSMPFGQFGRRKACFTQDGILAYDQRQEAADSIRTEYLVELSYGVSDGDFALPASPGMAP